MVLGSSGTSTVPMRGWCGWLRITRSRCWEAEERALREVLEAEFPLLDEPLLVDALVYCDMTTTPDGHQTTVEARVAEIVGRYGADSLVGRFIRRATPEIFAAVERVEAVLAGQPR